MVSAASLHGDGPRFESEIPTAQRRCFASASGFAQGLGASAGVTTQSFISSKKLVSSALFPWFARLPALVLVTIGQ